MKRKTLTKLLTALIIVVLVALPGWFKLACYLWNY